MKKSNFVALILGIISILCLGMGMSMCLLPEWNLFQQGIIVGIIGLTILLVAVILYRKMENKAPIRITGKTIFSVVIGIIGALAFGVGMSMTMVYGQFIIGIVIGIIGISLLLCLIPMCKGLR